jgi:mono/diheme cytochrome c family protein
VLFGITKNGIDDYVPGDYQSDMPAYKDILTDAEIAAALSYIESTWPPEIQARRALISQQADSR